MAWRSSTTTTMAGSTCSSPTARRSSTPCRREDGPTSPIRCTGTGSIGKRADGTFTDVTEKAGVDGDAAEPATAWASPSATTTTTAYADLYVTSYGGNTLYRNTGRGTFDDVTARAGVAAGGWSASAGFLDYDNDGHLDLFVSRYLEWSFRHNRHCGEKKPGYRAYCHPDNFEGVANVLFRNNGDGTFTDVSAKAGIAGVSGKGLGVAFADYDDDGRTDVYVANDSVPCFLFRNKADGTFAEEGLLAGVALNEDGKTFAGMGVDFADYDNDGRPDVIVTNLSNERYRLFRAQRRRELSRRHQHRRHRRRDAARSRAGARGSSTTTTTAGRTCSWPRDT